MKMLVVSDGFHFSLNERSLPARAVLFVKKRKERLTWMPEDGVEAGWRWIPPVGPFAEQFKV